jgi:hypothetical protein
MILLIENGPLNEPGNLVVPPRPVWTPEVGTNGNGLSPRIFGVFAAPVATILATREGHADEATEVAVRTLQDIIPAPTPGDGTAVQPNRFFRIAVKSEPLLPPKKPAGNPDASIDARCSVLSDKTFRMNEVSMSWWLASTVQADLDAQLCDYDNRKTLDDLMKRLYGGV